MQVRRKFTRIREKSARLISVGLLSLKKEGIASTASKTIKTFRKLRRVECKEWMKTPLYTEKELQMQKTDVFNRKVLFSIVTPLYNTPERFLRDMIDSVLAQTYANWELCLADGSDNDHGYVQKICGEYSEKDSRIKFRKLEKNLGIAGNSNACIDMAGGDYISLLDHDDLLHPAALHDVMKVIDDQDAEIIYTDEATFRSPNLKEIIFIHFKPDYAPDNLLANNYICHFTSVKRCLIEECGAFREGYDGAQDHELMLRLTEKAKNIVHIPKVLYYWRASRQSTAESEGNKPFVSAAGIKTVTDHLSANGIDAKVELAKGTPTIYRVSYPLPTPLPKVSIIIPNYDHVNDLRACIASIQEKTSYPNYEIIIAENNSVELETFAYYQELSDRSDNVTIVKWPGKGFNWAAIYNYVVSQVETGEYLLLLNNDMEVITPDWIEEMLMYAQRPDVGVVGAMLYYPDGTIQHAGVILGLGGVAGHAFHHVNRDNKGYMGRLCYAQDLSAVTGACMLMRREVWDKVGGIDERFAVNFNDVDLCMRIRETGYLIIWTPYAELYHYESKSRGGKKTTEKRVREIRENTLFRDIWFEALDKGDPYYNPNLTLRRSDFSPKDRRFEDSNHASKK